MVAAIPVKGRKLTDVKIGELPSMTRMWDFTLGDTVGASQSSYYRFYKRVCLVRKRCKWVFLVWQLTWFPAIAFLTKKLKREQPRSHSEAWVVLLCIPYHDPPLPGPRILP